MTQAARPDPVASGCSTLGKLPITIGGRASPVRAISTAGACFHDEGGGVWLDFDMALGSVVWGYGRSDFAEAIRDALIQCGAASVPTMRERDAACALLRRLPQYEQVRFFKTGSDACSAAVRLARAATGREMIAADGYHGWHDWSVSRAYSDDARTLGILPEVKAAVRSLQPEASADAARAVLQETGERLAAVIVRPEAWNRESLSVVIDQARILGALVIFDEVTSHFKYGRRGVAGMLSCWPDLLCVSKGLANGLPLATVLGHERVMRFAAPARITTTFATESTAFAALMLGERLLSAAAEWPSWRSDARRVIDYCRHLIHRAGLEPEIRMVVHPGFFSIEPAHEPFKESALRYHIIGLLRERRIFSRGWFHGSDLHRPEHWDALGEALEAALLSWPARGSAVNP
jgi:glutamate-1-semialdehyde 2,1-aminomutase